MPAKRQPNLSADKTFHELVGQDLKDKNYRPVYFLVGEDRFRIETVVEHLRKSLLGPAGDAFNYHSYHGENISLAQVLAQALSYPMLGEKQVIWLRDAEVCLQDRQGEAALQSYLENPVATTCLVVSATKLDGRRKWVRTIRQAGYLFDFTPPRGSGLRAWVKKAAQKSGLELTDDLVVLLIDLVGSDLHALTAEIEKLSLLAEDGRAGLDRARLEEAIMDQGVTDQYDLINKIQPGDPGPALNTWRSEAAWGVRAEDKAPLLLWRIRKLALVAALNRTRVLPAEGAARAGLAPWIYKQMATTSERLGPEGLQRALQAAHRCDRTLKRHPMRSSIALERVIIDICADW